MINHLSIYLKIPILIICYIVVYFLAVYFYQLSLSNKQWWWVIAFNFAQVWNLILTGFLFFQTFKYVRLPASYYSKKYFESERFFRFLGVPAFRYVLVNSFFKKLNKRVYLKGRSKDYVKVFSEETKQSETSHLISLTFTLIIQYFYFANNQWSHLIALTVFSILFNIYPMLLQRKNRFSVEAKFLNK
jgi:hypothetical protein